jgi:inosine-uridine nucleoside N-ribohydrolase
MLELLLTLQDVWGYQPVLYDLSPLLWLIEPGIFQTVPMHLRVETVGMFTRGCLISLEKHATGLPIDECVPYGFSYQESPEVWVSQDMNVAQAKEVFVQTLLG